MLPLLMCAETHRWSTSWGAFIPMILPRLVLKTDLLWEIALCSLAYECAYLGVSDFPHLDLQRLEITLRLIIFTQRASERERERIRDEKSEREIRRHNVPIDIRSDMNLRIFEIMEAIIRI